jgi:hypothetical protein
MKIRKQKQWIWLLLLVISGTLAAAGEDQRDLQPMGSGADVDYAGQLWDVMEQERLVGKNEARHEPFFGGAKPHGMILELAYKTIRVNGHDGFVVVKKNYDGPGVTVETVKQERAKYLSSITVMYQRESGYDEDNQNWFWAKYKPGSKLYRSPAGVALAGRINKGETREQNRGCIYCHSSAGGGDYIFYPEIKIPHSR